MTSETPQEKEVKKEKVKRPKVNIKERLDKLREYIQDGKSRAEICKLMKISQVQFGNLYVPTHTA